jgi:nicotinamide mononucleotide (NMN) deamidase PncC
MFPAREVKRAEKVVADCRAKSLSLTVAESCTGGLLAALITEVSVPRTFSSAAS